MGTGDPLVCQYPQSTVLDVKLTSCSINNQYYLFYTVEDQENGYCFDQCVATSPSMDAGTWTDHG